MLGTAGLELTRTSYSDLTWTGRRARTSFFHKNKASLPSSKSSEDLIGRDPLQLEDMPVSDSEKLGVTILGRHFRDTMDVVPIKKRKFTLVDSPPPARGSSPLAEDSAGLQNSFLEQDITDRKASLQSENADFSGISILAAAACNSNKGCLSTPEFSAGSPGFSEANDENPLVSPGPTIGKGDFDSGFNLMVQGSPLSMKSTKELQLAKEMPRRMNSSSAWSDRSHWDLNTVMDDWEGPLLGDEKKPGSRENSGLRNSEQPVSINLLENFEVGSSIENQPSDSAGCSQQILCNKVEGILEGNLSASAGARAWNSQANGSINTDAVSASVGCSLPDEAGNDSPARGKAENHSVCVKEGAVHCLNLGTVDKGQSLDKEPINEVKNNISELCNTSFYEENDNLTAETNPNDAITEEQEDKVLHLEKQDLPSQQPEKVSVVNLAEQLELIPGQQSSDTCVPRHPSNSERQPFSSLYCGGNQMPAADIKPSAVSSITTETDNVDTTNIRMELIGTKSPHRIKVGNLNRSAVIAAEDPYDSDEFSDLSQNDEEVASGMEKVAALETVDEEYQYEDGELRVSASQCWGEECDEGEAEQLDYDFDNEEMDVVDAPADCAGPASLHAECTEAEAQETADELSGPASSSKSNFVDPQSCSTLNTVNVVTKVPKDHPIKDGSVKMAANKMMDDGMGEEKFCSQKYAESSDGQPMNSRTKLSGWDPLSDLHKHEALLDKHNGEIIASTIGTQLPSHIEGSRPSVTPPRKDKEYSHGNRFNDCLDESNSRLQKHRSPNENTVGGGSSDHFHGRARGVHCRMDSGTSHWGPRHGRPAGYYGSSDFRSTVPKNNAAAAAAVKVESSGFFVTSDGTLVKAGGVGAASRIGRQSENASSQGIRRGSAVDVDESMNSGMKMGFGARKETSTGSGICNDRGMSRGRLIDTGHRERYSGHQPYESFDVHHPPNTSREGSFSPFHRRPLRLSHSAAKSRSRSRSHSPHTWERQSSGGRDNGVGCFQRRSRSPSSDLEARIGGKLSRWRYRSLNFDSEARAERGRSPPWRQPGLSEHRGYGLSCRNNRSPPPTSRWINDKNEIPDRFTVQDYKRASASDRSPSRKIISRNDRFHMMEFPGRLKPDAYYRPIHSGRYPEFVSSDRGPRHAVSIDGRRKQSDGHSMDHSRRHQDFDGDMKQHRYDMDNGFMAQSVRSRNGPDFNRRERPRGYGRGMENWLGDATVRRKEGKDQFRYGRERNQTSSFNQFGVRESEGDSSLRRRPS